MIYLHSSFLRRCYLRRFYHRMRGLGCRFFFRSLECNSYLRKSYHRNLGLVSKFFFRKLELEYNFDLRKFYLRNLGLVSKSSFHKLELVSKFFFRRLELECNFSFRSLECKSSYRRLGLECRYVPRKFYHRRSCHRMVHIRFFFVGLGRSQFFFVVGCSNLYRPFVALGRIRWIFVGLGCSVGRMEGRKHLSFVVGCSKYRFLFWLLALVRIELLFLLLVSLGVGHLVRRFLRRGWRRGSQGKVPRMRTKSKR